MMYKTDQKALVFVAYSKIAVNVWRGVVVPPELFQGMH